MREALRDPVGLIVESVRGFRENDGTGVSAETAYRLVIALPAVIIMFTSISSFVARYTGVDAFQGLLDRARGALPFEVYSTLELVMGSIEEQSGFGIFSIGLAIALWSGSNAINAIVKGINRAFGVADARGMVRQRLISLGLLAGLGVLMFTSFALLAFGSGIRDEIGTALGLGDEFNLIWNIARWPLLLLMFMGSLAMLYWIGPARSVGRRALLPGAVLATLIWFIAAYAFNIYLAIVDPASAYGIVGSIIALMLFLYISSIVIMFGAEVNAAVCRRLDETVTSTERVQHPLELMPDRIDNPAAEPGSRLSTSPPVRTLIGASLLGNWLRRGSREEGPPA